jgi:RES domain-containing protein
MMVFRLAKKAYVNDLSGRGAEINGGRWNSKQTAMVYTSASRALAAIEIAVHAPPGIIPRDYYMLSIDIPDHLEILEIDVKKLKKNWDTNPSLQGTKFIGDDFTREGKYLIMRVPSATIQGDYNYLINPKHPDFGKIKASTAEPFSFDHRLFKK